MFQRSFRIALVGLAFAIAACGGGQTIPDTSIVGDAGSACLVGDEDCYETGAEGTPGNFDEDAARQAAHGVLGMFEDDLPADVRIARRGEELLALTEDHVPGRLTVELEDTDGSGMRVVLVTLELPGGQETYELTPG